MVYKARVALKKPITGNIVTTISAGILKPTGGGYGKKNQLMIVIAATLKTVPSIVNVMIETVSFLKLMKPVTRLFAT